MSDDSIMPKTLTLELLPGHKGFAYGS